MRSLQFIEIDVPYCSLVYGVAPCAASLGVTGDIKCHNSLGTCQDRDNYDDDPVTLRFAISTSDLPPDVECIPSIKDISFDPATISLGENLGQRATLTVNFEDHRHSDTGPGGDKYLADRDYDPFSRGTYWGKFRARNPFLRARNLRWLVGRVGQALSDMETRHFLIESFTGPLDGRFTIVAKDILKLADGDRALAPAPNSGFLVADIDAVTGSASLSPSGIGDAEYPASGFIAIGGKEICAFNRTGDALALARGQLGTVAQEHAAQDRVQWCLRYDAEDAADIIADLLENYADVPSAYIPIAAWQAETSTYLNRLYTATIANPTSVKTLVSELIEQAALAMWWEDIGQQIGLQVLRGIPTEARQFTEENWIAGSLSIAEQPEKRISQVMTYFGQVNPLTSVTDVQNYRAVAVAIDQQSEEDYGSKAIKQIFSRWIPPLGRSVADRLNSIQIARFKDSPRKFSFKLMRHPDEALPRLAGGYQLGSRWMQDATGADELAPVQITRLNPAADMPAIEAQEMLFSVPDEDLTDRVITIDFNTFNINLRTAHDSIFPEPQSGDVITCRVLAAVLVGSISPSLPALDIGDWPSGVTINLEVRGLIQGAGGGGGSSNPITTPNGGGTAGVAGGPGGTALFTRVAINLDAAGGFVWGGGGGGGSGGSRGWIFVPDTGSLGPPPINLQSYGGGGGGGSGTIAGPGGFSSVGFHGAAGAISGGGGGNSGSGGSGGNGGGPGLPGTPGNPDAAVPGGAAGAAGIAVDGISFVTVIAAGDRRGPEGN